MDLRTGRLSAFAAVAALSAATAMSGGEPVPMDLEPVPADLEPLAKTKMRLAAMAGTEPKVNMRGQHPLAKWGRDKRKEKKKAKVAAASRRRNR